MDRKIVVPSRWQVPKSIRGSVSEVPGSQRALEAEGHLLLILHRLPAAQSGRRELRMFWRNPDGKWESDELGSGIDALRKHVTEFRRRVQEIEAMENRATSADDYFRIRSEVAPVYRAAKNMSAAISRALELCPDDRGLLVCRNVAASVERTSELLKDDATYGLEYTMTKQAESQALASRRLNLIAAVFFPIMAFSSIFGMNIDHGFEHRAKWVFWLFVTGGITVGLMMTTLVFSRKKIRTLRSRDIAPERNYK